MSRKYLEHMLDEMEYANYHRWFSTQSHLTGYNLSSQQSEFRNSLYQNRYDSLTRGCYMPPYMLLPNISKKNRESYYLVKRNEHRNYFNNYYAAHYKDENGFYSSRKGFENRKNDRSSNVDGLTQNSRRQFMNCNGTSSIHRFKENREENWSSKYSSRISNRESNDEASNFHLNQIRRYVHKRLESPKSALTEEDKVSGQLFNRLSSNSLLADKRTAIPEEEKCFGSSSSIPQFSSSSLAVPSPDHTTEYASWYCAEEQQQIVNMLRDVNFRHERQLRRDIITARGDLSLDESTTSNFDQTSSYGQQRSCSSDDEDDGITVLVSPSDQSLPDVMNMEDQLDISDDYLEKSASDYFEEFQSIFTVSPEKKIVNTWTKECLKEEMSRKLAIAEDVLSTSGDSGVAEKVTPDEILSKPYVCLKFLHAEKDLCVKKTVGISNETKSEDPQSSGDSSCGPGMETVLGHLLSLPQTAEITHSTNQSSKSSNILENNSIPLSKSIKFLSSGNLEEPLMPDDQKTAEPKNDENHPGILSVGLLKETSFCPPNVEIIQKSEADNYYKRNAHSKLFIKVPKPVFESRTWNKYAAVNASKRVTLLDYNTLRSTKDNKKNVIGNNSVTVQTPRQSGSYQEFDRKTCLLQAETSSKNKEMLNKYGYNFGLHSSGEKTSKSGNVSKFLTKVPFFTHSRIPKQNSVKSDTCLFRNVRSVTSTTFYKESASESQLPYKDPIDFDANYKRISVHELFHPVTDRVEARDLKKLLNIPQSTEKTTEKIPVKNNNFVSPTDHLKQILRIGQNCAGNVKARVTTEEIQGGEFGHERNVLKDTSSICKGPSSLAKATGTLSYKAKPTSSVGSQTEQNSSGKGIQFVKDSRRDMKIDSQISAHRHEHVDTPRYSNREILSKPSSRDYLNTNCNTVSKQFHCQCDKTYAKPAESMDSNLIQAEIKPKVIPKIEVQCVDSNFRNELNKGNPSDETSTHCNREFDLLKIKPKRKASRKKFKTGRFKVNRDVVTEEIELDVGSKYSGHSDSNRMTVRQKDVNKSFSTHESTDQAIYGKGKSNAIKGIRFFNPVEESMSKRIVSIVDSVNPVIREKIHKDSDVNEGTGKNKTGRHIKTTGVLQQDRNDLMGESHYNNMTKKIQLDKNASNGVSKELKTIGSFKTVDYNTRNKGRIIGKEKRSIIEGDEDKYRNSDTKLCSIYSKDTRSYLKSENITSQGRKSISTSEDQSKMLSGIKFSKREYSEKNLQFPKREKSPYRSWHVGHNSRFINSHSSYYEDYKEKDRATKLRSTETKAKAHIKTNNEHKNSYNPVSETKHFDKSSSTANDLDDDLSLINNYHSLNAVAVESLKAGKVVLQTIYRQENEPKSQQCDKIFSTGDVTPTDTINGYVDGGIYRKGQSPSSLLKKNKESSLTKEADGSRDVIKNETCLINVKDKTTSLIAGEECKIISEEQNTIDSTDSLNSNNCGASSPNHIKMKFDSEKKANGSSKFDSKISSECECVHLTTSPKLRNASLPQVINAAPKSSNISNVCLLEGKEKLRDNGKISNDVMIEVSTIIKTISKHMASEFKDSFKTSSISGNGNNDVPQDDILHKKYEQKESSIDSKKEIAELSDVCSFVTQEEFKILKSGLKDKTLLNAVVSDKISTEEVFFNHLKRVEKSIPDSKKLSITKSRENVELCTEVSQENSVLEISNSKSDASSLPCAVYKNIASGEKDSSEMNDGANAKNSYVVIRIDSTSEVSRMKNASKSVSHKASFLPDSSLPVKHDIKEDYQTSPFEASQVFSDQDALSSKDQEHEQLIITEMNDLIKIPALIPKKSTDIQTTESTARKGELLGTEHLIDTLPNKMSQNDIKTATTFPIQNSGPFPAKSIVPLEQNLYKHGTNETHNKYNIANDDVSKDLITVLDNGCMSRSTEVQYGKTDNIILSSKSPFKGEDEVYCKISEEINVVLDAPLIVSSELQDKIHQDLNISCD